MLIGLVNKVQGKINPPHPSEVLFGLLMYDRLAAIRLVISPNAYI